MTNPVDHFDLRQCLLAWARCSRILIPSHKMRLATDLLFACEEVIRSPQEDPQRMNDRLVRLLRDLASSVGIEHDDDWVESEVHSAKHTAFLAMGVLQTRAVLPEDHEETKLVLSRVPKEQAETIIAEAAALA